MATLKTSTRYSAGDLFAMDEDARFELIEGELVEMTLPTHEHGKLVIDLGGELRAFIRQSRLPLSYAGESGYLLSRDPDTVLAPDISVVAAADVRDRDETTGYPQVVPLLAGEILSPSNRPAELRRKLAIYLAAGVRLVWVVDPQQRQVTVHRADGTSAMLRKDDALGGEGVLPGFQLPLAELFEPE